MSSFLPVCHDRPELFRDGPPEEIREESCEVKERVVLDEISLPDDLLVGRGIPYKEVSLPDLGGMVIKLDYASVLPEILSRRPMTIASFSLRAVVLE